MFLCWSGWEGAAASVPGSALPHNGLDRLRRRLLHAAAATSPAAAATAFVVKNKKDLFRRGYILARGISTSFFLTSSLFLS